MTPLRSSLPITDAAPGRGPLLGAWMLVAITVALTAALLSVAVTRYITEGDGIGGDFLTDYAGGYLIRTGDGQSLYDWQAQEAAQHEVSPAGELDDVNPFVLPPVAAWAFAPLTLMPYRAAHVVFTAVNLALLSAAVLLLRDELREVAARIRNALLVAFALSMPAVTDISWGQIDLLLVLAALLCWRALRSGHETLAGFALLLTVVKPQFAIGIVTLLLVQRRWRTLAPLAIVGPVVLVVPGLLLGTGAVADYAGLVSGATHLPAHIDTQPQNMANWRGLMNTVSGGDNAAVWVPGALVVAAAAAAVTARVWRTDPGSPRAYALAWMLPLLVSPHVHMQSLMLLFVAIAFLLRSGVDRVPLPRGGSLDAAPALLLLHVALFVGWFLTANEIAVMVALSLAVFVWSAFAQPAAAANRPAVLDEAA